MRAISVSLRAMSGHGRLEIDGRGGVGWLDAASSDGMQHVTREVVARVNHVRAHGATGEGARTQLAELVSLTHIECDRHDLDTQGVGEPGNRRRGVNPARIREHDR